MCYKIGLFYLAGGRANCLLRIFDFYLNEDFSKGASCWDEPKCLHKK